MVAWADLWHSKCRCYVSVFEILHLVWRCWLAGVCRIIRLFGHPVGSWGEAAGGEEHAESVVLAVAETASEAAV